MPNISSYYYRLMSFPEAVGRQGPGLSVQRPGRIPNLPVWLKKTIESFTESLLSAGSYLTFSCTESSSPLHSARGRGRAARLDPLLSHRWRKSLFFQSAQHPLTQCPGFPWACVLPGTRAHTTPTTQARWRCRKYLAFNEYQSSFLRECGFCWPGRGRWAVCTSSHPHGLA